ncbi:hypothetical protein V6N13_135381 [Hibiscus sabdariffa]|uniref:DUF4283 domain-containing protein n=1 Tax=Hibiscus sabdariffa TaxID=183260 RepID=A0ABR2R732_9ROSI
MKSEKLEDAVALNMDFFLFKFYKKENKTEIMKRRPWSFNGDLLALKEFDPILSPEEYDFSLLPIWVHFYKVSLGWMTKQLDIKIWNMIDKSYAMDMREGAGDKSNPQYGDLLRVLPKLPRSAVFKNPCIIYVDATNEAKSNRGKSGGLTSKGDRIVVPFGHKNCSMIRGNQALQGVDAKIENKRYKSGDVILEKRMDVSSEEVVGVSEIADPVMITTVAGLQPHRE